MKSEVRSGEPMLLRRAGLGWEAQRTGRFSMEENKMALFDCWQPRRAAHQRRHF